MSKVKSSLIKAPVNYVFQGKSVAFFQIQKNSLDHLNEHIQKLPDKISFQFDFPSAFFGFFLSELVVLAEHYTNYHSFPNLHVVFAIASLFLTVLSFLILRKRSSLERVDHLIGEIKIDIDRIYKEVELEAPDDDNDSE